eukprot:TRINITY_DN3419_c0_g1_i1.p1 TRINITY_DN3419_c0_g1~~TRINITY_DN3419_c0_g1_i1.p1  ORF type:complete len:527 (+),score=189.74 TRINITY_DN3419_c0_g1_i1:58-1581(+)
MPDTVGAPSDAAMPDTVGAPSDAPPGTPPGPGPPPGAPPSTGGPGSADPSAAPDVPALPKTNVSPAAAIPPAPAAEDGSPRRFADPFSDRLGLDDVDVFLRAVESGDFMQEARHAARKAAGETKMTPAQILDPIIPPAGTLDMLYTYDRDEDGMTRTPAQSSSQGFSDEQAAEIRRLSRKGMQLNGELAAKLNNIVSLCEEMEEEIGRRRAREAQLVETNTVMEQLLNSLLDQSRRDSNSRRQLERTWQRECDADVGPLESRVLRQRSELRSLQRQAMLIDTQLAEEDAKVRVLQRELVRLDPAARREETQARTAAAEASPIPPQPLCPPRVALLPGGPRGGVSSRVGTRRMAARAAARMAVLSKPGRRVRVVDVPTSVRPSSPDEMTPRLLLRVRSAFDCVDELAACDGSISRSDLQALFSEDWGTAERLFRDLDIDGNGDVTPQEWVSWFGRLSRSDMLERLEWIEERAKKAARGASPPPAAAKKKGTALPTLPSPPYASTVPSS